MRAFYTIVLFDMPRTAVAARDVMLTNYITTNYHSAEEKNGKMIDAALVEGILESRKLFKKGNLFMHMGYFASYSSDPRRLILMHEGSLFMTVEEGHDLGSIRYTETL